MARRKSKRGKPLPESGPQRYRRFVNEGQQGCPVGTWAVVEMTRIAGCFRKEAQAEAAKKRIKRDNPRGGRVTVIRSPGRPGRGGLRKLERELYRDILEGPRGRRRRR